MNKIKAIAKKMALDSGSMDKKTLIRAIQQKEGNTPCFKTDLPFCDQYDCCWRDDCKPGETIDMA
jgi:hypothetical protein